MLPFFVPRSHSRSQISVTGIENSGFQFTYVSLQSFTFKDPDSNPVTVFTSKVNIFCDAHVFDVTISLSNASAKNMRSLISVTHCPLRFRLPGFTFQLYLSYLEMSTVISNFIENVVLC